jgi:isopentenyl-diphosphate delta-isomerase
MEVATQRRLQDELGIGADLEYVYQFRYQAFFGEPGSEHELCSVYLGRCNDEVRPNSTEIDAIRFLNPSELSLEMTEQPDAFTPWFKQEWGCLNEEYGDALRRYTER